VYAKEYSHLKMGIGFEYGHCSDSLSSDDEYDCCDVISSDDDSGSN
jgi:hypothetical protein